MRRQLLVVCAVGLFAGPVAAQDDAVKGEMKKLQGTWKLVSLVVDGKREAVEGIQLEIAADRTVVLENGKVIGRSTFQIDPTKNPKTWDDQNTEGALKGTTTLSIYKLEGARLTYCVATSAETKRPTEFVSNPGSGWELQVWNRVKP